MKKTIFLLLPLLTFPLGVSAGNVDVTANPPSGTYQSPIRIVLTPTENTAKTFYSFKPDGYPGDAFLYTGTVLLKHSSPFIYFSIVSTSNESKIKQNNYIIEYPSTVQFENEIVSGSGEISIFLINNGSGSVNAGFWQIQSESDTVTLPEDTVIDAGARHSVLLRYSGNGSVALRSPDGEERDILVPVSLGKTETVMPIRKPLTTNVVPRKIISTAIIPEQVSTTEAIVPEVREPEFPVSIEKEIPSSIPSVDREQPGMPTDISPAINQIMKASVSESGQKNISPLYFIALIVISWAIGGTRWFLLRKQK